MLLFLLSAEGSALWCQPISFTFHVRAAAARWAVQGYPGLPVVWCQHGCCHHGHCKGWAKVGQGSPRSLQLWCFWVLRKLLSWGASCKSRCHEGQSVVSWRSRSDIQGLVATWLQGQGQRMAPFPFYCFSRVWKGWRSAALGSSSDFLGVPEWQASSGCHCLCASFWIHWQLLRTWTGHWGCASSGSHLGLPAGKEQPHLFRATLFLQSLNSSG